MLLNQACAFVSSGQKRRRRSKKKRRRKKKGGAGGGGVRTKQNKAVISEASELPLPGEQDGGHVLLMLRAQESPHPAANGNAAKNGRESVSRGRSYTG